MNIDSLSQTLSVFLYRSLFLFLCTGISSLSSTSYLKEYTALEGSYAHHCTTNAGIHFSVPWGEKVSSFYSAGFISGIRFVPYCFIYYFFYTWNVPFWLLCHMAWNKGADTISFGHSQDFVFSLINVLCIFLWILSLWFSTSVRKENMPLQFWCIFYIFGLYFIEYMNNFAYFVHYKNINFFI